MSTTAGFSETTHTAGYTNAMIYGYGTAAVAVISSLSLLGVLLFPVLNNRWHEYVLQFFIALGVGTMTADALIHVVPDVVGGDDAGDPEIVVWKMSVVFGGIYLFFVLENGLKTWRRYRAKRSSAPLDDLPTDSSTSNVKIDANVIENVSAIGGGDDDKFEADHQPVDTPSEVSVVGSETQVDPSVDSVSTAANDDRICFGFSTVILTVGLGDALHNVTDGIAIGVSFAESATAGIGTSIAIMFHEIPHELGDFAIFLKNGASKWQAVALNAIFACFAFIGLYFGIAVSQNDAVRMWILAFVAGTFLYIALVQVTTEMTRHACENPGLQFLLQNLGLLVGWTIMLLLGLYEGAIEESVA